MSSKKETLPREQRNEPKESVSEIKPVGKCSRCGRRLTDPVSVRRGMGPVCWGACGGGIFEADLEASPEEWERRAQDLRKGGEWDFGTWDYVVQPKQPGDLPFVLHRTLRVSVRFREGKFEAYGHVGHPFIPDDEREVVFYRGDDIRACWAAAIAAGPECNAVAHRIQQATRRRNRRVA